MRWPAALAWTMAMGLVTAAHAAPDTSVPVPAIETAKEFVSTAKTRAYADVLDQYQAAERSSPAQVERVVVRCRFVSNYADDEYDAVESASDDYERCLEDLRTTWADAPEAKVFLFEQDWVGTTLEDGEALLEQSAAWPEPLRRDLLSILSQRYTIKKPARARELALDAARLGAAERIPLAIARLVEVKDEAAAAALLRDASPADNAWDAGQRVEAAIALKDPQVARAELRRYEDTGVTVDRAVAARVHLRAGETDSARTLVADLQIRDEDTRAVVFDVALAAGDMTLAAAQIDAADVEHLGENLERFVILLGHAPGTLALAPMLMEAGIVLVLLLFLALLPAVLLIPVHYRGLVRRAKGRASPVLFASIGLRHAWWGLFVLMAVPLIVCAVVAPESLAAMFNDELQRSPDVFRIMLWGMVICLVVLLPQLIRVGRVAVIGDRSTLRYAGWVLLAWVGLFALAWALHAVNTTLAVELETQQTRNIQALVSNGIEQMGVLSALLLMVVLVPIFEETVFRGLMLGGMARHISFGWANLLQGLVFASIHFDPPRFLWYLALGCAAGFLVRRSGSLGPAIALHALQNGFAFFMLNR